MFIILSLPTLMVKVIVVNLPTLMVKVIVVNQICWYKIKYVYLIKLYYYNLNWIWGILIHSRIAKAT
jgi:hypothetical protein